jgi:hypothetical protein
VVEFQKQDVSIESMVLSRPLKLLFCGTNKGSIRVYPWPLIEDHLVYKKIADQEQYFFDLPEFTECIIHNLPIEQLSISHDHKYLICGI